MGRFLTQARLRRIQAILVALVLLSLPSVPQSASSQGQGTIPELSLARQIVLVLTEDWDSSSAKLYRFERSKSDGPWNLVSGPWESMIGVNGLAWGYGLHPRPESSKRLAVEGDDRSPAGVFRIFQQFGFSRPDNLPKNALPFLEVTSSVECVDDPASHFYNQIVDRSSVKADWNSSEAMRSFGSYERGIDFSHNHNPIARGLGSCIFIHEWGGPGEATRGCTVLVKSQVKELAEWLRSDEDPLIVQLPLEEYRRVQNSWGLPLVDGPAEQKFPLSTPKGL